jgi:hypothetical protein
MRVESFEPMHKTWSVLEFPQKARNGPEDTLGAYRGEHCRPPEE